MKLVRHGRRSFGVAHTRVGVGALLTASRRGAVMLALGSAVLFGCDDDALAPRPMDAPAPFGLSAEQATTVLAKVGDRTITLGDYALLLERMNEIDRSRYQSKKRRRDLLQEMIDIELLAQEAKRRGLDRHPEVQDAVRQILRDAMRAKIHETVRSPGRIGAEEVKAYYDAHPDEFSSPELRRAAHIRVATREEADQLLAQARAADTRAFRELARERSTDPETRLRGGDLRYFDDQGRPRNQRDPQVDEGLARAAFALEEIGATAAEPVQVGDEWSIVRLTGRRPAEHRTVEQAAATIRLRLWRQNRQGGIEDFVARLRRDAHLENIDYDLLRNIHLDEPEREDEDGESDEGASAATAPALEDIPAARTEVEAPQGE